jgi:hypothetical protein
MELISREAALAAISDDKGIQYPGWWYKDRIRSVPEAQRWIPVSERLPYAEYGESDNVLATCGHWDVEDVSFRWIRTLYFNGGNWCYPTGETYEEKVYAWMPLPDPYKEVNA